MSTTRRVTAKTAGGLEGVASAIPTEEAGHGTNREAGLTARLVAIDDDPDFLYLVQCSLDKRHLDIKTTTDPEAGLKLILRERPQIVLLDLVLPGSNGMEILEKICQADPTINVILLTGHYSTESAVEAMQKGAADYLIKPVSIEKLRERVGRFVEEARQRQRVSELDHAVVDAFQLEGIVGRSPVMLDVFDRVRRFAPHFRTVLLSGATGTGKELVARVLHKLSPRASGPLVTCNCSALTDTLFESELFGHVKGSFTGAVQDQKGYFEYANGGTLFLDEVAEIPLATQAKLLRAIQENEIQRVGSPVVHKVDVRVVAATNRDLRRMVTDKEFRDDLFYRLAVLEIKLPRLVERREDLPLLTRYMLEKRSAQYGKTIRGLSRRTQTLLARYPWPGNVRELENVLAHACIVTNSDVIDVQDLPDALHQQAIPVEDEEGELLSIEHLTKHHILRVLKHTQGSRVEAAKILGVSRTTLYRLMTRMEEEKTEQDPGPEK